MVYTKVLSLASHLDGNANVHEPSNQLFHPSSSGMVWSLGTGPDVPLHVHR
jgi:hypothetical protein